MSMDIIHAAVILLGLLAVCDLVAGVTNDAVNFLNAAVGCRVAPLALIFAVASLGIVMGVTFSNGMMEVARKGIFHPSLFTMPELMTIFLGIMISDILLLDTFSTRGLPTSTTVSIVFSLLGAAVAVSLLKIRGTGGDLAALPQYINTGRAILIIFAILLSVVIAFVAGAFAQVITRLVFTFDYIPRMRRWGALWGGAALACIIYFILIKGAKGASFMTPQTIAWIKGHDALIILAAFAASALALQVLIMLRVNIFKPIILLGTFALAMAFAANDLVNFIGVPMAGYHAYRAAAATADPLHTNMVALQGKISTETMYLVAAGIIMAIAMCVSRKARRVIQTSVALGQQAEGEEHYDSIMLSRVIVRSCARTFDSMARVVPAPLRDWFANRLAPENYTPNLVEENRPAFDPVRAAVNLVAASALIAYATSHKLPLSTTYVTFMVAMGTSFADRAWGRESAVYRITGVLTVIGGWFITAIVAFSMGAVFAAFIYCTGTYGVGLLLVMLVLGVWNNHRVHTQRAQLEKSEDVVFNLAKVNDVDKTVSTTFRHMSYLLEKVRESLRLSCEALFNHNIYILRLERKRTKQFQRWGNIIAANVFKAMRLLEERGNFLHGDYAQTVRRIQKLVDGHRDTVMRAYMHVGNHHQGLLPEQVRELKEIHALADEVLARTQASLSSPPGGDGLAQVIQQEKRLRELCEQANEHQMRRIRDGSSKTRLSILFYAILGNTAMLCRQCLRLLEIFESSFGEIKPGATAKHRTEFDMD